MRWLATGLCALLLWLPLFAGAADVVPLPPLKARVTDLTGTLTPPQQTALAQRLAALEKSKGAQVGILMLPTTQPEPIAEFGIRLAEAWKLGRKGVDDGVIVIVAKQDRRMRIEVGYGLEGAIPDAVAKRIVSDVMAPRFKQGDFHGGLTAAVDAIEARIGAEAPSATEAATPGDGSGGGAEDSSNLFAFAIIGVFVVGGILRALLGSLLGAGAGAGIAFLGAWWLLGSILVAGGVALIAFFVILLGLGGHWGGSGSGFSGGSFGGGDSFSGGGGDFGGGGASGEW